MRPTLLTAAVTLAVTLGSTALPEGARAAPPRCEIVVCSDLVVSRVASTKGGFYVTVKNVGARRADALSWLGAERAGADPKLYLVPALFPGQARRLKVTTACSSSKGWTVRADWTQAVVETNEGNNRRTYTC
jgi:subtilase family serine protease